MSRIQKVLLTAFEPFGGRDQNPSLEVQKCLLRKSIKGLSIKALKLPVTRKRSCRTVLSAIQQWQPDVVLMMGEAAGRASISLEQVALNIEEVSRNRSKVGLAKQRQIEVDGPCAYFSTLPNEQLARSLATRSIPAELSHDAGLYICNRLFYKVRHFLETQEYSGKAGFIHLPLLPEQVAMSNSNSPSQSLRTQCRAVKLILKTLRDGGIAGN